MSGIEGEDLEAAFAAMFAKPKRATVAQRREKETRVAPRAPKAQRSEQLNLSFRPGFKKRLQGVARDHGLSMTAVLEAALEEYIKATGWGQ